MQITGLTVLEPSTDLELAFLSIQSVLPICHDFLILVPQNHSSVDKFISLAPQKVMVKAVEYKGQDYTTLLNLGYATVSEHTDWVLYLRPFELFHERTLPLLQKVMLDNLHAPDLDGFLFPVCSFNTMGAASKGLNYVLKIARKDPAFHFTNTEKVRKAPNDYLNVACVADAVYRFSGERTTVNPTSIFDEREFPVGLVKQGLHAYYTTKNEPEDHKRSMGEVLLGVSLSEEIEDYNVV